MIKNKRIKYLSIFMLMFVFAITNFVYAAGSFSVSASKTSLNPGNTATITIKTNNCAGKFSVSSSNTSVATVSAGSTWVDGTATITVTAKANGSANITVTPVDVSDTDLNDVTGSKSVTIKVTTPSSNTNTNKPSSGSNSNSNTNKNKNSNKNNTSSKSSNANLKNMMLSVEGLSPAFAKNITSYSVNIGENVDTIKVNASVEHNRASYSVSGNTNLKVGENIITVKVTAEDGTVKTYKITVLKSDDPVKSDATLSSVIIEDVNLGQAFDPNVTEYNAGDITVKSSKLNILAYPNNDNAKVEILGNENLGVGEGKITIRVTSENGKVTKDYVIAFNKLYAETNANNVDIYGDSLRARENNKPSFWSKLKDWYEANLKEHMTVIVLYVFVWVEFLQVVYLYERLRKYEDLDKITVGKRINREDKKEKAPKEEKPRRAKQNPVFPEETENKE